jgi:hypothetical protein
MERSQSHRDSSTPGCPRSIAAVDSEVRDERIAQLRMEISTRLQRVCSHLTPEQFAELVLDIAPVTLRYEDRLQTPIRPERRRDD